MTRQRYDTLMSDVRDYTMIVVGQILYAIGFCVFILPHQIVIGGMTGVGTLVYFATGGLIPVAVTMYGCNIALLIAGFRMLGKTFLIRTIFGATGMSIFIGLIENYFMNHRTQRHFGRLRHHSRHGDKEIKRQRRQNPHDGGYDNRGSHLLPPIQWHT